MNEKDAKETLAAVGDVSNVAYFKGFNIGADNEFMITTPSGRSFPASLVLPKQKGGMLVYHDGRQGEFGIKPTSCREYAQDRNQESIIEAKKAVDKFNTKRKKKLKIEFRCAAPISVSMINKGGDDCRISGCVPDFNANDGGAENPIMEDFATHTKTYAGSHVHFGLLGFNRGIVLKDTESICRFVRLLDKLVAIPSMLVIDDDTAKARRKVYGRAGCYRLPDHGLEYRTLGADIMNAPEIMSLCLGGCMAALGLFASMNAVDGLDAYDKKYMTPSELAKCDAKSIRATQVMDALDVIAPPEEVKAVINNCDREGAVDLWKRIRAWHSLAEGNITSPFYPAAVTDVNHGTESRSVNPLAAIDYMAADGYKFDFNYEKNWHIDTPSYHGNHAKGWIFGVGLRLNRNKDFAKFMKSWRR